MENKIDKNFSDLRKIAEEMLDQKNGYHNDINVKIEEIIHELQVYQIELEVQNEELRRTESKLIESESRYFEFFEVAPIGFFNLNPNGLIIGVNFKGANLLGQTKKELINRALLSFITPKSRNTLSHHIDNLIKSKTNQRCELTLCQERYIYVHIESKPFFDKHGDIKEILMSVVDINELKKTEKKLKNTLNERDILLREINHRVKNNLQIIASLLHLQQYNIKDTELLDILKKSEGRVNSMAMIHEKLFHSNSFSEINFKQYIQKLLYDILSAYDITEGSIKTYFEIEDIKLNMDTAIPLGLITNELITNIVKHAFPESNGTITIKFKSLGDKIEFIIADDGVGISKNIDPKNSDNLGLELVENLVKQLDGYFNIKSVNGTEFKMIFKELEYKERG